MASSSTGERAQRGDAGIPGVRRGVPHVAELSRQTWVADAAVTLLPTCVSMIHKGCADFTPLVLFLGGSAIHGELCGIVDADRRQWFLSDLDFGIVTARRIPLSAREEVAHRLKEATSGGPIAKIGFYDRPDLGRQDPTPGMVETVRSGYVLDGDGQLLRRFRMPEPSRVPTWEARRLLSNRLLEWAESAGPTRNAVETVYAAAKLLADLAAVCLLGRRSFVEGGYQARADAVEARTSLSADEQGRIRRWTQWRLMPRWSQTPLGEDVPASAASPALRTEVREGVASALRAVCGSDAPSRFLQRSDRTGRAWARAWKRWRRSGPMGLRRVGPRDLMRTPRVLLWEATIEWALGRTDRSVAVLSRLAGECTESPDRVRESIVRLASIMVREGVD